MLPNACFLKIFSMVGLMVAATREEYLHESNSIPQLISFSPSPRKRYHEETITLPISPTESSAISGISAG